MHRLPRWAWVSGSAFLAVLLVAAAFFAWPSPSPTPVSGISGMGVGDVAQSIPATSAPAPSASPSTTPSAVRSHPPTPTTASTSVPAGMRAVTLVNTTSQTVWGAASQDSKHPLATTSWVLKPGQSATVAVPSSWGGRFWGRTGCTLDGAGKGHCATGDGGTPTTLAEFALAAWGGMDFYDVSNVDGSNLPMYINISHSITKDPLNANGCGANGCVKPINCPAQMQLSSGACQNPCAAFGGDTYCCRGAWAGRANCIPSKWPVDYTKVFKTAMPYGYSYAFDDSATMACKGNCNYRITFGTSP